MSHFAMLCVPAKGRLFPMLAIARALLASGHRVTLIGRARMASEAQAAEVDFVDLDSVPFEGPSLDQHRTSAIRRFLPSQIPRWGSGEYAEASGLRAVAISIEAYRRWAAFDLDRDRAR